jgi:hypothetical protein
MIAKNRQPIPMTPSGLDATDLALVGGGGGFATTAIPGLWAGPDGTQSCVFGPGVPAASTTFLWQQGPVQTMVRVGGYYYA